MSTYMSPEDIAGEDFSHLDATMPFRFTKLPAEVQSQVVDYLDFTALQCSAPRARPSALFRVQVNVAPL